MDYGGTRRRRAGLVAAGLHAGDIHRCHLLRRHLSNPQYGDIFNIVGFGVTLTAVTVGSDTVTITYIGP
jgi:hypothetical protein